MQRLSSNKRDLCSLRSYLLMYALGSVLYTVIELLYRGHTHPSMVFLGGVCGAIIHRINRRLPRESLLNRAVLCALAITAAELITGLIVNRLLDLHVWDYSDQPLHLWGQICLPFTFCWFLLSFPALFLSRLITDRIDPSLHGSLFFHKTE